jgi:hypothetical protein
MDRKIGLRKTIADPAELAMPKRQSGLPEWHAKPGVFGSDEDAQVLVLVEPRATRKGKSWMVGAPGLL